MAHRALPRPVSILLLFQEAGADRQVEFQVTGGGAITVIEQTARQATLAVKGGGVTTLTAAKGAEVTVSLTGGGRVLVNGSKVASTTFSVAGGGSITIETERSADPLVLVIELGGNPAPRPEPEWTPAMDDEAVMSMLVAVL